MEPAEQAALTLSAGTVLGVEPGLDTYPLKGVARLDARKAMSNVISAFLGCVEFVIDGGTAQDTRFALERVSSVWPTPDQPLVYPSLTVLDPTANAYQEHSLTPTPLEDTQDVFCPGTVLWKTAEASLDLQLDFWCDTEASRQAIAARLPSLFGPYEGRSGVVLAGDPGYFHRVVRATLLGEPRRMDVDSAVYENERRLMVLVRCDIDVVHLRGAVALKVSHKVNEDSSPEDC